MSRIYLEFFVELLATGNMDLYDMICKEIKEAKTDEDRIIFAMHLCSILKFKPAMHKRVKNAKNSEEFREEGNKFYTALLLTSETCFQAYKCYCLSIACAPIGSKQQALAYANRSAVLCRMRKYAECLKDIERAFSSDYPNALRIKLYLRKIECLAALKDLDLDKAIDEANSWSQRMSMNDSDSKKLNDQIACLVTHAGSKRDTEENIHELRVINTLPKIKKPNPEAPCASNAVAIKYNKKYGRHLVATRNIEHGEVLIVEKPYTMVLKPTNFGTHCHYCLEVCWATIPCDSCICTMYCSEECKSADWKASHDIECPIFSTLLHFDFNETDLMSLRLAILAIRRTGGMNKLKGIIKEVDKAKDMRTKGFSKDGVYQSDQYRSIYSLVTNTEKRSGSGLLIMPFKAFIIVYFLSLCPNQTLIPKGDDDTFVFIGGLILRHQQMIQCNAHAWEEEILLNGKPNITACGVAVIPFMGLLNHTCSDQTIRQSAFGHSIIYSLCPIKKGQQILYTYGPHYTESPKTERQKILLDYHFFSCDCVACREDWPLYKDMKSFSDLVTNANKRRAINNALNDLYQDINHEIQSPGLRNPNTSRSTMDTIRLLYRIAPPPCLEMFGFMETLRSCYISEGNRFYLPEL